MFWSDASSAFQQDDGLIELTPRRRDQADISLEVGDLHCIVVALGLRETTTKPCSASLHCASAIANSPRVAYSHWLVRCTARSRASFRPSVIALRAIGTSPTCSAVAAR